MEIIKVENLSFTYPNQKNKTLDNINICINKGEFVTLCGKSGCGKTTLLRLMKTALSPVGNISGKIYLNGMPLSYTDSKTQAQKTGFVMQNPDNQIVTDKVWHELAFGLENLGLNNTEIRTRVSEMASFFGIGNWFHKKVTELSGGQKQILNLASVMVMQPSVLILDEPTSLLDPIAASKFLNILKKINRELGTTVILSEHRLEEAIPMSHRVIVMDKGKITADDTPRKIGGILKSLNHDMYEALPVPMQVYGATENDISFPLTVCEGREWLEKYIKAHPLNYDAIPRQDKPKTTKTAIEIKDVRFRYKENLPHIINSLNLEIRKNEIFAIVGGNGAGKTTTVGLMSGLITPCSGNIYINGKNINKENNLYNGVLGVLPQNPQSVFVKKTVYLDLLEMLSEADLTKEEKNNRLTYMAKLCRIDSLLQSHPYDLSGGEQQRAALCKILLKSPDILILDEPTKGLDMGFKEEFADILLSLKASGTTIVMVSHDIEFCAEYADRCGLLFDGTITSVGNAREFFSEKKFYTTSASRMAGTILPDAVLAEDIILALGGSTAKKEKNIIPVPDCKNFIEQKKPKLAKPKNISKRTLIASLLILLIIPITIYTGVFFLEDRKYYFISLLIILETMVPFCFVFESRKPQARELVIISVLCAVAVAGRAAFFMLPQFKPVVAIVIIAGICFSGESGFLVGAISGFVSNFFFGQGPWTPWQMFAFGIIGFVAGVLFRKNILKKNKFVLCAFGFVATFLIYGGIMNPASVIISQENITKEMIISSYIMGIPFDIIHSAATAFFLLVISQPMITKLERIQIKYGLIE